MDENFRAKLKKDFESKDTEELLEIWQEGDLAEWDASVFEVIQEILQARLVSIPPAPIHRQVEQLLDHVDLLFEEGNLDEALQGCDRVIQLDPNQAEAHHYRGLIREEQGELQDALSSYQTTLHLDPGNEEAAYRLDTIKLLIEENYLRSEAKQQLDRALEFAARGQPDRAWESCELAKPNLPELAIAHAQLGLVLDTAGKLEQALAAYRRALQLDPDSEKARDGLLDVEADLEQEFLESGIKRRLDQALEYANMQETERAWEECESTRPDLPDIALAHNYLGLIMETAGRLEPAISAYQNAVRLNPRFYAARENLANARVKLEQDLFRQVAATPTEAIADISEPDVLEAAGIPQEEDPIPPWVYMSEAQALLIGWPGYRNRPGRFGLDPLEVNSERGHMVGVLLRLSFGGHLRTRDPLFLGVMILLGLYLSTPLLSILALFQGEWIVIGLLFITAPYWLGGVGLLANAVMSLGVMGSETPEDHGFTFF